MNRITSAARRFCFTLLAVVLVVGSVFVSVAPASAAEYTVKMGSDKGMLVFEPAKLAVKPGDTVKWVVNNAPPHNVIFDAKAIPGQDKALAKSLSHPKMEMSPGKGYDLTIPSDLPAGEYTYFCAPHRSAGMVGQLVVGG